MATSETNPVPVKSGAYLWAPPDKPVSIYLSLDVVDHLLQDVMRGFGAVPRRGAEVGGILLGKSLAGDKLQVDIDGYELVPIEYRLGPSYLLSDADRAAFAETLGRLSQAGTGSVPVGFFRSQTRDGVGLAPEDLELLGQYFPGPDKIVLMIRPFATRVSTAGFYFREDGSFPSGPPLAEFNFRRKDLGGGEPAPLSPPQPFQQAAAQSPAADRVRLRPVPSAPVEPLPEQIVPSERRDLVRPSSDVEVELQAALKSRSRGGWVWLPLSFIFLLLGVLLGFQAALTLRPQIPPGELFNVGLTVARDGDNLSVRWDRQAAAVRAATQGLLMINDGTNSRPVSLTSDQLQTGSVVYPHKTGEVKFRLELTLRSRAVLVERLDWKE